MPCHLPALAALAALGFATPEGPAQGPLHERIDQLMNQAGKGQPTSARSDDAEFLRRVYLDLAGRIPNVQEARAFLADPAADKRQKLIDHLLASPDYPRRMQEFFHVLFMERLGDHPEWTKYLRAAFAANKPWDQMAREILRGTAADEATRGAVFFYSKRLENYGQNPVDYPALTRDVGRLFLGIDLRCAQCHDHLFVKDYKQADFQGLFAFFQNVSLQDAKLPAVAEKPTTQKLGFSSVFRKTLKETGPRIPGQTEIAIPVFAKGKEFLKPPDKKTRDPGVPRFSTLAQLAEQLPRADNPAFARNFVNRLWFALLGRGLVHPLDLHHKENPPSHPEVLALLAQEFIEHNFDIKWMLRELALTETYQRSSVLPAGVDSIPPESFRCGLEKRLAAEQLLGAVLEATGERTRVATNQDAKAGPTLAALEQKFVRAFANPRREPEDDFNPSLKAALFLLNDEAVLSLLDPRPGNLVDRLQNVEEPGKVAEELYLSVLTRLPTAEERVAVAAYLAQHAVARTKAVRHLAWALLASTEFGVNH